MAIDINIKGIQDFNAAIDRLSKTLDRVETNLTTLIKSGSAIDRLFGGMTNFKDFTTILASVSKDSAKTFKTLTKSMQELAKAVASIPTGVGNDNFLRDIKELIQITQTASVPAGGGRSPIAAIQSLVKSILRLNADIKAGASPRELISFVKDFSQIVTAISKVATESTSLNDFDTFAKAIDRLGTGLKKLVALKVNVDLGNFAKVRILIVALGNIFEALNKAVAGASKQGSGVDQFSFIIDRLGRGFRGLDSIKDVGIGRAVQISKFLAAMAAGLRVVGKISGQNANASAFGTTISSLFEAIERISKLNLKTDIFRRTSFEIEKPLKQLINVVLPLFERIAKASKGNVHLGPMALMFQALGDFFDKTSKIVFKESNFKQFKSVAKHLADGLNELDKVSVDPAKLNAIANALEQVESKLGNTQFRETGFNLGDELKRGLIQAGFTAFFNRLLLGPLIAARGNAVGLASRLGSAIGHAIASGVRFVTGLLSGLRQVGSNLRELGENFRTFGTNLNQNFGLGSLFQSGAFQTAIEFDKLSTQVQVFGNLTEEQLEVAQDFSDEIGIQYPLSANQAQEALLNLLKAGLDLNSAMQALPSAADLAALSDTGSVDTTSRILIQATQAFEQFNETTAASFENSAVAADLIAQAANNSTASVESLGEALVSVGPIASNMGLTLEETVAIFGLFSDAGVQGAAAGTQLRSMLNGLTRPTEDVQNTFNELGVSLTDQAGNIRDFNDIVNDLNHAMNDAQTITVSANGAMSASDRERFEQAQRAYGVAIRNVNALRDGTSASAVAAGENAEDLAVRIGRFEQAAANSAAVISELSGSQEEAHRITVEIERSQIDNVRAIQSLAGTFGQVGLSVLLAGGEDAIKGFIDEMGRLPTAAEQAQLLLDNMAGDIEQLKGSFETLTKDVLIPLIARAFRPLVKALRVVVDGFNNAPDSVKDFISNLILFGSTLATVVAGVSVALGVIISFGGVIATAASFLATFALAPGLVIAALAGLAASLAALVVVGTVVVGVFTLIAAGMTEFFTLTERDIGGAGTALKNLGDILGGIATNIGAFLSAAGEVAGALLLPQLAEDQLARGEKLALVFNKISGALAEVSFWSKQVADFGQSFADFLSFDSDLQAFEEGLGDAFGGGAIRNVETFTDNFIASHRAMLTEVGENSVVRRMLGLQRGATPEEVTQLFLDIRTQIESLFTDIRLIGKGFIGSLFGLEGAQADLERGLSGLLGKITGLLQQQGGIDFSTALLAFNAGDLEEGVRSFVGSLMDSIGKLILDNRDKIVSALTSIFNFFLPGSFAIPTIAEALGLHNIAEIANSVFQTLRDAFGALVNTIFDVLEGQTIEEALLGNFGPAVLPVIRLVKSLGRVIDNIVGIFKKLAEVLFPSGKPGAGKSFFELALSGIADAVDFLNTQVLEPLTRGELPNFAKAIVDAFNTVTTTISTAITNVISFVNTLIKLVGKLFSGEIDVGTFFSDIFTKIDENLKGLDPSEIISRLAQGILGIVNRAIAAVPGLLISVGDTLGIPLLSKLGHALQDGTFETEVARIAEGIKQAIQDALGRIPALLSDLNATFIQPLITKIGEAFSPENVGVALNSLVEGIKSVLREALRLAGEGLTDLGTTFSSSLLANIGTALTIGNIGAALDTVVTAIKDLLREAVIRAGQGLADIGQQIGTPILTTIGTELATGDLAGVIGSVAGAFAGLILDALKQVPDLLIGLGTLLGSPILIKLGNELKEGAVGEALKTLVDGFVSVITTALGNIPEGLINIGNFLGIQGLKDIGGALKSAGWKEFADALGRIATFAFDKVIDFIDSVTTLIGSLKGGDLSENFIQIAGALVTIAPLAFPGLISLLGTMLKFAKGFLIFEIVTATLDELAEIARGDDALDIATLGDILIRITSDILGLAGVEISPDEISQRIIHLFSVLNFRFTTGFRELAANINAEIERILLSIAGLVTRTSADLASVGGDNRLQLEIQGLDLLFADSSIVGADFFTQVSQAIATSVDPVALAQILATKMGDVRAEFNGLVQDGKIEGMTPGEQAALIHVLLNTGSFDQIILDAPPGLGERLLQSYLDINPETARAIDWGPILNQLQANAITQAQQIEAANLVQMLFGAGGLTREEAQPILDGLKSDFDVLQGFIDTSGEVVNVPIIIGPQFSTGEGTGAPQDLSTIVSDFLADQTAPIASATPFQLPVEIDTSAEYVVITATPEEIEARAQAVLDEATKEGAFLPRLAVTSEVEIVPATINTDKVDEAFEGVKTKAQETAAQIDNTVLSLQTYGTESIDQTAASTISWVSHAIVMVAQGFLIRLQVDGITSAIIRMKDETLIAQSEIGIATGAIVTSFTNLNLLTAAPLDALLLRLKAIRDVTSGVTVALTDLGIIGGDGLSNAPGRRRGGDVRAGKPYEVLEDGISELLSVSGKTYLIPGKNGRVDPLGNGRSTSAWMPTVNRSSSSQSNVSISEGDVYITVQGGSARDAAAIADSVGRRFEDIRSSSREDVRRRLINGGRTGV